MNPDQLGEHFHPAWWLPGRHLQTLWGKLARGTSRVPTRRERWETPDGDFVDLERLDGPSTHPRLLVLHGLEGSSNSHYAIGLIQEAQARHWAADVLIFRSCGGELNRTRRFYHSGETTDLAFVVDRLRRESPGRPLFVVGVSLGGNVLLKWLGEVGESVPHEMLAAAAVSVPFDLGRGSRYIDRGFSRIYQRYFIRSLVEKARRKSIAFPDIVDHRALDRIRSLLEFDDAITAPVHGFLDADDYYRRSSALHFLSRIRLPTLLLSAIDDPFLPRAVLDEVRAIATQNPALDIEFHPRGGHVGFVAGSWPWRADYYMERRVGSYLARHGAAVVAGRGEE